MHTPGGVDEVEGPHPFLVAHARKQLRRTRGLQRNRPQAMPDVELEHACDHELAQPAVGVVQEPVLLSRAAA
jgi:hypothetical protein